MHYPHLLRNNFWRIVLLSLLMSWLYACGETNQPGSRIYMRGYDWVIIRLNAHGNEQQVINIGEDGVVVRASRPVDQRRSGWLRLSNTEFQQVRALREQWCTSPPRFPTPSDPAMNYDIGFRCGTGYEVTQFSVPPDALPAIVQTIEQQVPPLEPRP